MNRRRRRTSNRILGLAAAMALTAGGARAVEPRAPVSPVVRSEIRAAAAPTQRETRRVEFSSAKTDDWLCRHDSAFFCSSVFPTSSPTPPPANNSRGRGRG